VLNWDDLKFFLAVCRAGSIRAAAQGLGVNHATVSRRINNFEASLGERVFDRTQQGYVRTRLGDEIFEEASYLEERLSSIDRKIVGKDENLEGEVRVTMPDLLGQHLLMEGIVAFCRQYPLIDIQISGTVKLLNLANREADVAFRICDTPPEYLIGRRLAYIHRACYIAREFENKLTDSSWLARQKLIGWTDKYQRPIGVLASAYPRFDVQHKISNGDFQLKACESGLGISVLPCLIGDVNESLVRVPPYVTEKKFELWVLSHPDLRKNAKIQAFVRFMTDYVLDKKSLIEGEEYKKNWLA